VEQIVEQDELDKALDFIKHMMCPDCNEQGSIYLRYLPSYVMSMYPDGNCDADVTDYTYEWMCLECGTEVYDIEQVIGVTIGNNPGLSNNIEWSVSYLISTLETLCLAKIMWNELMHHMPYCVPSEGSEGRVLKASIPCGHCGSDTWCDPCAYCGKENKDRIVGLIYRTYINEPVIQSENDT